MATSFFTRTLARFAFPVAMVVAAGQLHAADPIKLNSPLTNGGDVLNFQFSPDSSLILYRADQDVDGRFELYTLPSDGSAAAKKINGPLTTGGSVSLNSVQFSPDSELVLYRADAIQDGVDELFTVVADGSGNGQVNKINGVFAANRDVIGGASFSPDGTMVVFKSDQRQNDVFEIWGNSSLGGAPPELLSGQTANDGHHIVEGTLTPLAPVDPGAEPQGFEFVPGTNDIIFRGNVESGEVIDTLQFEAGDEPNPFVLNVANVGVVQLYRIPSVGGVDPEIVNGEILNVRTVNALVPQPPDDEGNPVDPVSEELTIFEGDVYDFKVSPDGNTVAFRGDVSEGNNNVLELNVVSATAGGMNTVVSGPLVPNGQVLEGYQFSPDSSKLLYRAEQTNKDVFDLYVANADGSGFFRINNPLQLPGGDVLSDAQFSPDSGWVVYRADQEVEGRVEIFAAPSDGSGPVEKLSATFPLAGTVYDNFKITPDSTRVIFRSDQETPGTDELYSAPIDGSSPAVKLNAALPAGGDVASIGVQVSPDSQRVIYVSDQETDGVAELWIVPSRGGTPRPRQRSPCRRRRRPGRHHQPAPASAPTAHALSTVLTKMWMKCKNSTCG